MSWPSRRSLARLGERGLAGQSRPGPVQQGLFGSGEAVSVCRRSPGESRPGAASQRLAVLARFGPAGSGAVRTGAGSLVGSGAAGQLTRGAVWRSSAWRCEARQPTQCWARPGLAQQGWAAKARMAWRVVGSEAWAVWASLGSAGQRQARQCPAWMARQLWPGAGRSARHGWAANARQG